MCSHEVTKDDQYLELNYIFSKNKHLEWRVIQSTIYSTTVLKFKL